MASISALGVGSNLNLSSLLDQLSSSEQARLTPLTQQQSSWKAKLTAWGVVQSSLEKVKTASAALANTNNLISTKITSDNKAFSASVDAKAVAGSYQIEVTQLAQAHSLNSAKVASSTSDIGSSGATLTISQPGQKEPLTVTLNAGATSLTDIRDAINKQQGSVSASIIKADDNSYYLSLTARDTGVANQMTVSVSGNSELADQLNYDPANPGTSQMRQTVAAQDAKVTINDIPITRSSNTITDAPEGLTLSLTKTNVGSPEQLTVAKDNTATTDAIKAFVDAYNSLQTTIASQTKYTKVDQGSDAQDSSNGDLLGDGTLRNIQTQLRSAISGVQGGDFVNLSALGISLGNDGKLTIDNDKLAKALNDKPASVSTFFSGADGKSGWGGKVNSLLESFLASDGSVATAEAGINDSLDKLSDRIDATTKSINATIARYKTQFTQLDTLMSKLNNTTSYLTQQFEAMNS